MTPLEKPRQFEAVFAIHLTAFGVGVLYLFLIEILHLEQIRGLIAGLGVFCVWVVFDLSRRASGEPSLIRIAWANWWLPIAFWGLFSSSVVLFGLLHQFGQDWFGDLGGWLALGCIALGSAVLFAFYSAHKSLGPREP